MTPGRKAQRARYRERKRQQYAAVIAELRAKGASCKNCRSFKPRPGPQTQPGPRQMICAVHSDFYGYVLAKPDGICDYWHEKEDA